MVKIASPHNPHTLKVSDEGALHVSDLSQWIDSLVTLSSAIPPDSGYIRLRDPKTGDVFEVRKVE